jgi:hypothetical protein
MKFRWLCRVFLVHVRIGRIRYRYITFMLRRLINVFIFGFCDTACIHAQYRQLISLMRFSTPTRRQTLWLLIYVYEEGKHAVARCN